MKRKSTAFLCQFKKSTCQLLAKECAFRKCERRFSPEQCSWGNWHDWEGPLNKNLTKTERQVRELTVK